MKHELDKKQFSAALKRRGWGGLRIGAGRNAKRPEDRRPKLSTTVSPQTRQWFQYLWDRYRWSRGQIIDAMVRTIGDEFERECLKVNPRPWMT